MKNVFKKSLLMLSLTGLLALTACEKPWPDEEWVDGELITFNETIKVDPNSVSIGEGEYHSKEQLAYIKSTWDTANQFANGEREMSIPDGVKITLNNENDTFVRMSLNKDFSNARIYQLDPNDVPNVKNLLSGKTYYYQSGTSASDFVGEIRSVKVSNELPRNLFVEGVTNVRDLGGYQSKLGGKIKQGLFYRGGRLTFKYLDGCKPNITDEGLKELTQGLGVKTEIDLRDKDPYGGVGENGNMDNSTFKDIEYKHVPMNYGRGKENMMIKFKDQIKEVFDIYSDVSNYPIYVHCSIGTDRTGLIAFLMGALLGMDIDDLCRDYLFSNFGEIHNSRSIEEVVAKFYWPTLKSYKKSTLQRCTEAYLLDIGISRNQIETIKNIMIEK